MKHILMACGTGICTSSAVRYRVSQLLDEHGYEGKYEFTQCRAADVPELAATHDFVISTCMMPRTLECPFVNGIPFLTGADATESIRCLLALMAQDGDERQTA